MYKRILVPLDGSTTAESVLPYVRALAAKTQAPVTLLHAIDPEEEPLKGSIAAGDGEHRPADEYLAETQAGAVARYAGQQYLKTVAATFTGGPVGVEMLAVFGRPAEVIVREAAAKPGTLVTMSTHGRTGIGRWVLGSVAGKVLQATTAPLLLVRGGGRDPTHGAAHLDQVILPLDGSTLAEAAFDVATEMAMTLRVPLLIVRVVPSVVSYYVGADYPQMGMEVLIEAQEESANQYLDSRVKEATLKGATHVSRLLLRGLAAGELIDLGQRSPHSIMVMSTHGRSGIGRWALGSVTDRVARHTGQPVLVVRPKVIAATEEVLAQPIAGEAAR